MSCLFISANFFGYARKIQSELNYRFLNVFHFEDRPSVGFFGKVASRLFPRLVERFAYIYFRRIADKLKNENIRHIFVIKGESLSVKSVLMLRERFPNARFTLYFWDGYKNMPASSRNKVDYFDTVYSFDVEDVRYDSRLIYRPLFYINDYSLLANVNLYEFDVLFVGTVHSDRYKVLKKIEKSLPSDVRFKKVMFCPSKKIFLFRKIFDPTYWSANIDEFTFKPLSTSELLSLVSKAKVVVDIERTAQTGLTMRTIEMLGASRKLITTNKNIVHADFYDCENICVVDRESPEVSHGFLKSPWKNISPELINSYSLKKWVDDIFNNKN